jgi:hypothetical protein
MIETSCSTANYRVIGWLKIHPEAVFTWIQSNSLGARRFLVVSVTGSIGGTCHCELRQNTVRSVKLECEEQSRLALACEYDLKVKKKQICAHLVYLYHREPCLNDQNQADLKISQYIITSLRR